MPSHAVPGHPPAPRHGKEPERSAPHVVHDSKSGQQGAAQAPATPLPPPKKKKRDIMQEAKEATLLSITGYITLPSWGSQNEED